MNILHFKIKLLKGYIYLLPDDNVELAITLMKRMYIELYFTYFMNKVLQIQRNKNTLRYFIIKFLDSKSVLNRKIFICFI